MRKRILDGKVICLIFTLISGVGSLLYLLYFDAPILWNIIGIFLLLTDLLVIGILQAIAQKLGRTFTKKVLVFYGSLILKYGILFLANFIGYGYQTWSNVLLGCLIYGSVWGTLIMGILFVFHGYKILESHEPHPNESEISNLSKKRVFSIIFISALAVLGLIGGIIMDIAIIMPRDQLHGSFVAGIMAGMMGIFLGVVNLAFTGILLLSISVLWSHRGWKGKGKGKNNGKEKGEQNRKQFLLRKEIYVLGMITVLGLIIASLSFLPLVSTPNFTRQADEDFNQAFNPSFGGDWQTDIPSSIEQTYFLSAPFQLAGYFLGSPTFDCITLKDILYFNGTSEAAA